MMIELKDLEKVINSGLTTLVKTSEIKFDQLVIHCKISNIFEIILFLKNNEKCKFKQLIDVTAIDYPEKEKRFRMAYFFLSHENNSRIIINSDIEINTKIPSITSIFPAANWMEREVFDMYGIFFSDHPDLRRILTDYEFEGYPLRKDFPLTGYTEVRYSEDKKKVIYESVKLDQNYRNFDFESPWEGTKYIKEQSKNKDQE
jgi:NADH-quinone oxidoreductase subunit C|tara:strand:- start:94 stop:699 length:606 start_codon:yes stop_codon:yes gene_type:complete